MSTADTPLTKYHLGVRNKTSKAGWRTSAHRACQHSHGADWLANKSIREPPQYCARRTSLLLMFHTFVLRQQINERLTLLVYCRQADRNANFMIQTEAAKNERRGWDCLVRIPSFPRRKRKQSDLWWSTRLPSSVSDRWEVAEGEMEGGGKTLKGVFLGFHFGGLSFPKIGMVHQVIQELQTEICDNNKTGKRSAPL